jgi:hypothetical protein
MPLSKVPAGDVRDLAAADLRREPFPGAVGIAALRLGVKVSASSAWHRKRDLREAISFESSAQNKRKSVRAGSSLRVAPAASLLLDETTCCGDHEAGEERSSPPIAVLTQRMGAEGGLGRMQRPLDFAARRAKRGAPGIF